MLIKVEIGQQDNNKKQGLVTAHGNKVGEPENALFSNYDWKNDIFENLKSRDFLHYCKQCTNK